MSRHDRAYIGGGPSPIERRSQKPAERKEGGRDHVPLTAVKEAGAESAAGHVDRTKARTWGRRLRQGQIVVAWARLLVAEVVIQRDEKRDRVLRSSYQRGVAECDKLPIGDLTAYPAGAHSQWTVSWRNNSMRTQSAQAAIANGFCPGSFATRTQLMRLAGEDSS